MRLIHIPKGFFFFKVVIVVLLINLPYVVYVSGYTPTLRFSSDKSMPVIHDPNLRIEEVIRGLDLPTSMAFLGKDDILVLEKDKGTVQRIVNGQIMNKSIIDVNVSTDVEIAYIFPDRSNEVNYKIVLVLNCDEEVVYYTADAEIV